MMLSEFEDIMPIFNLGQQTNRSTVTELHVWLAVQINSI